MHLQLSLHAHMGYNQTLPIQNPHEPHRLMQIGYIDDPRGPVGLSAVVITALTAILILSIVDFVETMKAQ